ncbi:MAG: hypothetical protein RIS86_1285 [Planctomycetota bacterium]
MNAIPTGSEGGDEPLVRAWREAADFAEVERFFLGARARIAEAVRAERPICLASGACCRFEAYGHRMYLSGLEAAFVVQRIDAARARRAADPLRVLPLRVSEVDAAKARGDCPYLVAGANGAFCGEHEERPLGCRIFYCDRGADGRGDEWQSALYEEVHAGTLALHEALGIPYRYLEWREALATLAESR